ncbi:hypothetical protein GCM10025787_32270 [Saccharopolyspora rosea]|uniref:Vint domain-containing protein n=1 Tax=Saccharopolyspora rosea TaxID=524884 RepID=A0ABW3FYW0_9PSEU
MTEAITRVDKKDVEDFFAALPGQHTNPIGSESRRLIVNHVKGSTPGNYSQLIGTGPAFRDLFFPGYRHDSRQDRLAKETGLNAQFWSDLAVTALCQQIHEVTSRLRPQIRRGDVDRDLRSANDVLKKSCFTWYAYLATSAASNIATTFAKFSTAEARKEALDLYTRSLTSEAWINGRYLMWCQGNWGNQHWELYHHWIKLYMLGATFNDVDRTIRTCIDKGLPVPGDLGPARSSHSVADLPPWATWSAWWFTRDLGVADFAEADSPIKAGRYSGGFWGSWPVYLPEDNSFEFTANGQPGSRYRSVPSGSCFAPGTQVVLADGTLRNIEDVRAGDEVSTPSGPRRVLLAMRVPREDRTLHRLGDTGFAFSATHPFVLAQRANSEEADYGAADPEALSRNVPTFAQHGVRSLRTDAPPALVRRTSSGTEPYQAPPARPDPDLRPQWLHDLYLEVGEDGLSEYFAGDTTTQVLVSSEAPLFAISPLPAHAILTMLEGSAPLIMKKLADTPDEKFPDAVNELVHATAHSLLGEIGAELTARVDNHTGDLPPLPPLHERVRRFVQSIEDPTGYNVRLGFLVERFVAEFAPLTQTAIPMGWRSFALAPATSGTVLSVTVHGIHVFASPAKQTKLTDARIRVELRHGEVLGSAELPVSVKDSTIAGYYVSNGVAYFSAWRPTVRPADEAPDVAPWELDIGLDKTDGTPLIPFTADVSLPWQISSGYEQFRFPAHDADGDVVGQVLLDVRVLTDEGYVRDNERRNAWETKREPVVAHHLAQLTNEYIAKVLSDEQDSYRKRWTKQPR